MKLRMGLLAGAAALALGMGAADAAVVSFQNVTADWVNPNPANPGGTLVDGGASATLTTIRWGTPNPPGGQKSGYDFALAAPQPINVGVNPPPSVDFVLGTFTHQNWPINSGTSITGVQLSITIGNVVVDGQSQGPLNLLYNFTHFETPNDGNPCAAGGSQPCPDRVTVTFNAQSENFLVNGVEYTVNVLGFDGQSSFLTREQAATSADLIVQVAARDTVVPVPAAMAMFGVGLLGLGFVTRRRPDA